MSYLTPIAVTAFEKAERTSDTHTGLDGKVSVKRRCILRNPKSIPSIPWQVGGQANPAPRSEMNNFNSIGLAVLLVAAACGSTKYSGGAGGAPGSGGSSGSGGVMGTGGVVSRGGTTGSGGAGVGGATGLPYKGVANCTCAERTSLKVSWYYNWTVGPDNCTTGGEFVPMYSNHPNNNPTSDAVAAQITKLVNAGYKYVLGFNEPNKTDQANMTVASAIALWPAMTSNPNILVGSPATSADGQSWFTDFMNQVSTNGLRVDFIALHWYGWNAGSCDAKAANLESYIKWAENIPGNRPLWLTEWGCMNASNPDVATVQAFETGAIAMFAKHPRLERYAWYQWDTYNELTNADHSLTQLGTAYAAQPSTF